MLIDQLHAALGKVELALGVIDESIGWVSPHGAIEWCNGAFDRLVGRPHIYVLGARCLDLLPLTQEGRPVPAEAHPVTVVLRGQARAAGIYQFAPGPATRVLECITIRTEFVQGQIGAVFVILDITERRRAEETLKDRTAQLEAANRELEAFSYSVSHDLRAPLRAIAGFASILVEERAGRLDEDGRHCLEVIRTNAKQMGQLIDDLLAFSRLGRQPLALAEVDMRVLAAAVVEEARLAEPQRTIHVTIGPLPPATGDRALLHQVLMNLVSNAIKFTRPRAAAEITIGATLEAGETIYFVTDNGVGFDMQYADKLFGVFQRLHNAEEFEGTGVGLALVQRLIHRHGGRIWAESRLQQGTTFSFTLSNGGTREGAR